MDRPSREQVLMENAHAWSRRGTCGRLQVGCVIARRSHPVATGYVGAPSGISHCAPEVCNPSQPCTRTVHAEANAIAFAAREGISVDGCDLFTTDSPCMACAFLIINAGIKRVFYDRQYRDHSPIGFLISAGVEVIECHPFADRQQPPETIY